jgi:hypothetical protein
LRRNYEKETGGSDTVTRDGASEPASAGQDRDRSARELVAVIAY